MRPELAYSDRLAWVLEHMSRTARAVEAFPPLDAVRLACSVHIEIKMVAALLGAMRYAFEMAPGLPPGLHAIPNTAPGGFPG